MHNRETNGVEICYTCEKEATVTVSYAIKCCKCQKIIEFKETQNTLDDFSVCEKCAEKETVVKPQEES